MMGILAFATTFVVSVQGQAFYFEHNQTTPGGHGQFFVGHFGVGMPLYMSHIPANMNPHTFDATWQVRLFNQNGDDITDYFQTFRQHQDPGQVYVIDGPGTVPSEKIMLQQLVGPYFGLPQVSQFSQQVIHKGYDKVFVGFLAELFAKHDLPVATFSTGEQIPFHDPPDVPGATNVTVKIERVMQWRQFSSLDSPALSLSYHIFGTNEHPMAQHRVAGIYGEHAADWMQVFPFTFKDKDFLAEMAKEPNPATITKDSSGTWYKTSTAYLTMNVATGNCQMKVPGHEDSVWQRLNVDSSHEVDVEVTCEYFCVTDPDPDQLKCSNSFKDFGYDGPANTAMLPSKSWRTKIIVGKEQALFSSMALGAANPDNSVGAQFQPFVVPHPNVLV